MNRSSLYGLLNFFREYVPRFAEITEPIRELLGQDHSPWTPDAEAAVRKVVHRIVSSPRWLNASPDDELRAEPSVSREGIALLRKRSRSCICGGRRLCGEGSDASGGLVQLIGNGACKGNVVGSRTDLRESAGHFFEHLAQQLVVPTSTLLNSNSTQG